MSTVPEIGSHVQMSQYDWATGTTTYNVQAMTPAQRWQCAISQATEAARKRFPHSNDRIEKAYALVHEAKVVLHPKTKTATVTSSDGTKTYTVNGGCECPDAARAPEQFCKHRLAVAILHKASGLVKTFTQAQAPVTVQPEALDVQAGEDEAVDSTEPAAAPVVEAEVIPYHAPAPSVPAQFVIAIKGKPFVQFAGLLTVAHSQGLLSLTERVTHVTDTYVMAEARAEFEDGRVFIGVGDSSPDNVGKEVKPHWRRLAGTRAMARALRQALNIAMCSVEELE